MSEIRDVTSLVVFHRRAVSRPADQILRLKNGQVESQGSLETLRNASTEFQRLWEQIPAG